MTAPTTNEQVLQDRAAGVLAALRDNDAKMIDAFGPGYVPWDVVQALSANGFFDLIQQTVEYCRDSSSVTAFLRLAHADRRRDVFAVAPVVRGSTDFVDPIFAFILCGDDEALTIYIANGFDPRAPYGRDGLSAIQVAQAEGRHETASVMQACATRAEVGALLDTLSKESEVGARAAEHPPQPSGSEVTTSHKPKGLP